jgi:hypothetical protein
MEIQIIRYTGQCHQLKKIAGMRMMISKFYLLDAQSKS